MFSVLLLTAAIGVSPSQGMVSSEADRVFEALAKNRNACGPLSVQFCLALLRPESKWADVVADAEIQPRGVTLASVVALSNKFGLPAVARHFDTPKLAGLPMPAILVSRGNHCFVVTSVDEKRQKATVYDPAYQSISDHDIDEVHRAWTGDAVLFQEADSPWISIIAASVCGWCLVLGLTELFVIRSGQLRGTVRTAN